MAATEDASKTCYVNFGAWEHELIVPENLHCSPCSHLDRDLEDSQNHAVTHHPGPEGVRISQHGGDCDTP
eukprot:5638659-Pyramimonas_sp.AAC.1